MIFEYHSVLALQNYATSNSTPIIKNVYIKVNLTCHFAFLYQNHQISKFITQHFSTSH